VASPVVVLDTEHGLERLELWVLPIPLASYIGTAEPAASNMQGWVSGQTHSRFGKPARSQHAVAESGGVVQQKKRLEAYAVMPEHKLPFRVAGPANH
jgi:hypothetical protein